MNKPFHSKLKQSLAKKAKHFTEVNFMNTTYSNVKNSEAFNQKYSWFTSKTKCHTVLLKIFFFLWF